MIPSLSPVSEIECSPPAYLTSVGHIFAVFGEKTQDSGNISYGIQVGPECFFVKTAGDPADPRWFLSHSQRVALLRNAVRLRQSCDHPALPASARLLSRPTARCWCTNGLPVNF